MINNNIVAIVKINIDIIIVIITIIVINILIDDIVDVREGK